MDLNSCLKVLNSEQIRQADQFTINNEPIASIDLMERASKTFVHSFVKVFTDGSQVMVVCGTGNNGGDGLVIARLLSAYNFEMEVFVIGDPEKGSRDFQVNFEIILGFLKPIKIKTVRDFPVFEKDAIVIDAIFGSGLSRSVSGIYGQLIDHINQSPCDQIVAVDIASGLGSDEVFPKGKIIEVSHTFSFEVPKLSLLLPQNEQYSGQVTIESIGLNKEYMNTLESSYYVLTHEFIATRLKDRNIFMHKGQAGRALIYAGEKGSMGAAILAGRACMKSGSGLLTIYAPQSENTIVQLGVPEAISRAYTPKSGLPDLSTFDCIGIGPGIGVSDASWNRLRSIIDHPPAGRPLVLDADAINILSKDQKLLGKLPKNTILTPHPGEFRRLVGAWKDDYHRLQLQKQFSAKYNVIVLLKGANTSISNPSSGGQVFFNPTGNPGMATGGSGDVLTGIIVGLLAQGYEPLEATLLGVWLHGLAGDIYVDEFGPESLVASDLINYLPAAFQAVRRQL